MSKLCLALAAMAMVAGCGMDPDSKGDPAVQLGADNIYVAASQGDLAAARSFIEQDAWDSQRPDGTGVTPLTAAIEGGNVEIVRLMVENGADVNQIDARLMTPLQVAEKAGKSEMVEVLKEYGATK